MRVDFNTPKIAANPAKSPSFGSLKFNKILHFDIFEKTSEPDFLLQPPKKIFKAISKSIKSKENLIGKGGEAEVWKIKDTDYCVRIPIEHKGSIKDNFDRNLTNADKINHTVVKLGAGATIMPIIKGYKLLSGDSLNKDVSKMIENMPVSAFESLIKQVIEGESVENMSFDPSWENIIINPDEQKMTAIDFYKSGYENCRSHVLGKLFAALTFPNISTNEQYKNCMGKLFLASLNLMDKEPEIPAEKYGLTSMLSYIRRYKIIKNPNYIKVFETNLNKLESLPKEENIGNIKVLKALIRQLFGVTEGS